MLPAVVAVAVVVTAAAAGSTLAVASVARQASFAVA